MKQKYRARIASFFICSLASFVMSSTAHAIIAVEIPGIPGDSTVAGFEHWIMASSVETGFELNACRELAITKQLDRSTPLLIGAAVTGTVFPEINVSFTNSTAGQVDSIVFLSLQLKKVVIKSVSTSEVGDQWPMEEVRFYAQSIVINYFTGNETGEVVQREVVCRKRVVEK